MDIIDSPYKGRLRGRSLLLSASLPTAERAETYRRIEAAEIIEEAVVSLARAVFSEGGTLVFGGHPTISPLVALVVREYVTPPVAESFQGGMEREWQGPRVEIYQSEAYREQITEATLRLKRQPVVTVHWVEAVDGEVADPDVRDRPQAKQSLRRMRVEMVKRSDLLGMVCIGGMEGVEEEMELFHEHQARLPVFAVESTGGAAAKLARRAGDEQWVLTPEQGVRQRVEAFWREEKERRAYGQEQEASPSFAFPYAYIAQKIVAELINPNER